MTDLATGAMGSLIPKLHELLKEEYNLQTNVKERISSLTKELVVMQATLREVAQLPWEYPLDNKLVQLWARQVREASYDMEDALDTFLVPVKDPDSFGQESLLKHLGEKMTNLFRKSKEGREIFDDVKFSMSHLQDLAELRRMYKVNDIVARSGTTSTVDPPLQAMYNKVKKLVGMDKSSDELISLLQSPEQGHTFNMKSKVVSIVGVGGLGKTTLARAVYDKLKGDFDFVGFIHVGRNPNVKKVLENILMTLDRITYLQFSTTAVLDEKQLICKLNSFLRNKRYFIVVDDLWEVESWKTIRLAIPDGNNCGGRIIITTRCLEVGTKVDEVYQLKPLSYDSSRELLYTRIYGHEGRHVINEPHEISDKILRECGGIPLTIIIMASLIMGKQREEWFEVYETIGGFGHKDIMEANTTRILYFSYCDLPSHLKTCLLYISAFPEDYVIPKSSLIWMWMAEGFIHPKQGERLFEIGEGYFNHLINRGMIEAVQSDYDDGRIINGCRVHNIVLDFICSKSREENFFTLLDNEGTLAHSNIRRLAHHNMTSGQISQVNYLDIPKVRSFIAHGCGVDLWVPLSSFKLLRVLAIESCRQPFLNTEYLGHLLHLRFLGLRGTLIYNDISKEIGALTFLQTLDLRDCGISDLPSSRRLPERLMCLSVTFDNIKRYVGVPEVALAQLTSLEELSIAVAWKSLTATRQLVKELGRLRELRVLDASIWSDTDEEAERDLVESLRHLHKLQHLRIQSKSYYKTRWQATMELVLSCHLRYLNLHSWVMFSKLPSCINPSCLPNLSHLDLRLGYAYEKDLKILGRLPELQFLGLAIAQISHAVIAAGAFPKLQYCYNMGPLVLKFLWGAMPCLEYFKFDVNVREMKDRGLLGFDSLRYLPSLEKVHARIVRSGAKMGEAQVAEAALRAVAQSHPNRPNLILKRVGMCVSNEQNQRDKLHHSQVVESDVTLTELSDEQKLGRWGGFGQLYEGILADRRQWLNIVDATENNTVKSVTTFASQNDVDGEDEIKFFGSEQTDVTYQEGILADRRQWLNIGDETENNTVKSVMIFASQNEDGNIVDGEDEIKFFGSEQTDVTYQEGEMSSTLSITEFPTSASLGAIGPLLRKLDLLLDSEHQLIQRSTKEAIKLLKEGLEEIVDDLVELSKVERPNYKARYWMHEVRDVSYHIEDCIDNMMQARTAAKAKVRFSVRHLQLRIRRRVKIPWLPKTVQPSARIAELRTLLWEARERHERYQLQDCVSSEPRFLFPWNSRAPALPSSSGAGAHLVGVDGTRGKLTAWFIDQTKAKQLKVVSILGPAGVGKTALAKELYRQVGHQFECRAFVRVARNPDMRRLLGEILAQVQGRKRDYEYEATSTADNLMDSIRSHLRDKRYFVVIDELWDAAAWDIMNIAFPKGNNCSRIIITAEGKDVASKCYCVDKLEMAPLGNLQDCGKIFFDRVFGSEHQCPDQLKDISCMIIRNCGGFPLAITNIAGVLASHQIDNTELWHHIQQCLSSRLTGLTLEETCKEVVNICYDALPQDLKTCLLYLTMYPEGCTVRKVDLLNQWIAEGFISPAEAKQEVAENYFAELMNRGMIQPEKVDHNDEVVSCTMHHIVFDLIVQKSREENFITAVDYSQVMPRISMIARRLSLHFSCAQFAAKPEGLKLSQVRSLAFYGLLKCMPSITEFEFLRVLILEFRSDNKYGHTSLDLSKLCILFNLRYLKASSHTVIVLPSEIQRVKSLETLEIDAQVSAVPTDIVYLPGLLHLNLPNGTELPDGIGRITSLRKLEYFDLGNNSEYNTKSLGELINLQDLHVTCSKAVSDHHLKRNLVALSSSIRRLANLKSLRVGPFAVGMMMFIDPDDMPCTRRLLQRLEVSPSACIFSRLPRWIGGLQELRILKIAVRVLLSRDIDTLKGLPGLAVLSLYAQKSNAESVVFNSGSLPALKYFKYRCAAVRLVFQKEALPNLRRLKLCFNVHSAESYTSKLAGIENLLKLEEITAEVGAPSEAGEYDRRAAEVALKEATRKHPRSPIQISVKSVDCIQEESTPVGFMYRISNILGWVVVLFVLVVVWFCLCCTVFDWEEDENIPRLI